MWMRALVVAVALLPVAGAVGAEATPWERYLELPTPERAAKVETASYTDSEASSQRLLDDFALLEVQVLSRDAEAVHLAFRLRRESDGVAGEILDIMLGRLIRIDPQLFLSGLQRARAQGSAPVTRLDALLGNHGSVFVDRIAAQAFETERRIEALLGVDDPALRELRDLCVAKLREDEELYRSITGS